jgi:hypothetical protein
MDSFSIRILHMKSTVLIAILAIVPILSASPFVQSDIKGSPDCEDPDVACTVEELREYCRDAYPNNELGWYKCISGQVPTPNPGD